MIALDKQKVIARAMKMAKENYGKSLPTAYSRRVIHGCE
jgi:hypothetical protein